MLPIIKNHLPPTWRSEDTSNEQLLCKISNSLEYNEVLKEAMAAGNIFENCKIFRIQDIFSYGQFLIREQLLLVNHQQRDLFRVRRYVKVSKNFRQQIVKYNLDPRRCDIPTLKFSKELSSIRNSDLIVVVKVLTHDSIAYDIVPQTSCDYFIEYIIEVDTNF